MVTVTVSLASANMWSTIRRNRLVIVVTSQILLALEQFLETLILLCDDIWTSPWERPVDTMADVTLWDLSLSQCGAKPLGCF